MSEVKKLWEAVRELEEKKPDHTLNLIIATLLGNYGKEGRCIPGLITGEEMPKVQMLINVCEFYHKAYQESKTLRAQLAEAQKEAFPAYKREKALRCKAEAELAELREQNKVLREEENVPYLRELKENAELLFRIARGGKAIEAMKKIIASRETFLKSQMSVIGETDIPAEIFIEEVHSIIETFQDNPNGH